MTDDDTGRTILIRFDMMTGVILRLKLLREPFTDEDIKELQTGLNLLIPTGLRCAVGVVNAVKACLLREKLAKELEDRKKE